MKFLIDNRLFRVEALRRAIEDGYVRDYESMCWHFDFKVFKATKEIEVSASSYEEKSTPIVNVKTSAI